MSIISHQKWGKKQQRVWGQRTTCPLASLEKGPGTLPSRGADRHVSSQTYPWQGSRWFVHLLWHFCLPRARCWSGQHHRPLAGGNVYGECKDEQRHFYIQDELQPSCFFSILGSKMQACTFHFCTLRLVDNFHNKTTGSYWIHGLLLLLFSFQASYSKVLGFVFCGVFFPFFFFCFVFWFCGFCCCLSKGMKWFLFSHKNLSNNQSLSVARPTPSGCS